MTDLYDDPYDGEPFVDPTIPGVGAQYRQPDTRGWLVFEQLPDDLQHAEDATLAWDGDTARRLGRGRFSRRATAVERDLLAHLGYAPPDSLMTVVDFVTAGVRNRRWPQLEG